MILKNIHFNVNGQNLSAHLRGLTFTEEVEQQEATHHGDSTRTFEAGLKSGTITAQFYQDYTNSGLDDQLTALLADTDGFVVYLLPDGDTIGTDNPKFTATMNLASYERFTGEVGDRAVCSADFVLAAGGSFVRTES